MNGAAQAERKRLGEMDYQLKRRTEQVMLLDMLDRFVVAVERIADSFDAGRAAIKGRDGK